MKQKIIDAQSNLKNTNLDYEFKVKISQVCSELDVDGLRGKDANKIDLDKDN